MKMKLKTRIFLSFFTIIILLGGSIAFLGNYIIKKDIIEREHKQVEFDIKSIQAGYKNEINLIGLELVFALNVKNIDEIKEKIDLDYLYIVEKNEQNSLKSEIAIEAFKGKSLGGTRIIEKDELDKMGNNICEKISIEIKDTPNGCKSNIKLLDKAMAMEYSIPLFNDSGEVVRIIYGGRIINKNFATVDTLRELVFENRSYKDKPVGTVTIFFDNIRITTNVLDDTGNRAIGTTVSQEVYNEVVKKGNRWIGPARVVTENYYTAYEPIKDINNNIIGILYVGILEKPFYDLKWDIVFSFIILIIISVICAAILTYFIAESISRPITNLMIGAERFSTGELDYRLKVTSHLWELNKVAQSLNEMAGKLQEREKSLEISNEKLGVLNKSHLDLIGFVAHELKGILASTILNAYTLRDGFLGMINFKQQKALDSITRNLDYLSSTVRNFLNLSRIEKGEIKVNKVDLLLKEDIFNLSVDAFTKQAVEKGMEIINNVEGNLKVKADSDLLQVVANNLVGNAIKYGAKDGKIILNSKTEENMVEIEVYNDGYPIPDSEKGKLFKKFSRLARPEKRKIRGTGLGLFVTKEIIEKHGGNIRAEVREKGNSFIFRIKK